MIRTKTMGLGMRLENNLNDIVGNSITVSGGSPTYVDGRLGRGLEFDSANSDALAGPNDLANIGTGSLSVFCWLNYDSIDGFSSFIFCKRLIGAGAGQNGWFIRLEDRPPNYPTGVLRGIIDFSGVGFMHFRSNTQLSIDEWYHIGLIFDRDLDEIRIYINAELDSTHDISAYNGNDIDNTEDFLIGEENRNQSYYDGVLDEIAIYHNVINEGDIKRVMHGLHPLNG